MSAPATKVSGLPVIEHDALDASCRARCVAKQLGELGAQRRRVDLVHRLARQVDRDDGDAVVVAPVVSVVVISARSTTMA